MSSSQAGPSSEGAHEDTAPAAAAEAAALPDTPQFLQNESAVIGLLKRCFDPETIAKRGHIKNKIFAVRGNDGIRLVEIQFVVNGNGVMCELKWKLNEQGSVQSFLASNNQPVQPADMGRQPTGVTLQIFGRAPSGGATKIGGFKPYITVEDLFPSMTMNGKFVRSIVFQLQSAYTNIFQMPMYTKVDEDFSDIRESYWLQKGRGKTYFESVWNLEYECLLYMSPAQRTQSRQISSASYDIPANTAFDIQGYEQVEGVDADQLIDEDVDAVHIFDPIFIQTMDSYKAEKGPTFDYSTVTIRDCLNEFLVRLVTVPLNADPYWHQILHQNTFMFFFRGHPQFRDIARQVLHGYDTDCNSMKGAPYDPEPRQLQFALQVTPTTAPSETTRMSAIENADTSDILFTSLFFIIFIFTFRSCLSHTRRQKEQDLYMYTYTEL